MYKSGLGVNFCLIRDGEVLLQQRDENCPFHPLKWCFPGGGADEDDATLLDTAIREIEEEYELKLTSNDCYFLTKRPKNNPGEVYVCNVPIDQEPVLNEGKAMKWEKISDLENQELAFGHSEFITPILQSWYKNCEHLKESNPPTGFKIS